MFTSTRVRVIAVDWSGAVQGARRAIWLAEVSEEGILRLECGRDRAELISELVDAARVDPQLIVGLDFAFSTPGWYLRQRGFADVRDLWKFMALEGEGILRDPQPPFWRTSRLASGLLDDQDFRRTEREVVTTGSSRAQSVFKLVGAGHVGTGSIRGMAELHRLAEAGFSIWPFDEPRLPLVIEIYPRVLTGAVIKSDPGARRDYLRRLEGVTVEHADAAAANDNAFDALVSALVMWRHRSELTGLPRDSAYELEGRIWAPEAV